MWQHSPDSYWIPSDVTSLHIHVYYFPSESIAPEYVCEPW